MEEKVRVTQDALYQYLMEHNIKLVRLAELMGMSEASINVCFKHYLGTNGQPRVFTPDAIVSLNNALSAIARELRGSLLSFGSDQTYTNRRGKTYDPALVEPLKKVGTYINLTALVERVLEWNKRRKENILTTPASKIFGYISEEDVNRINAEILSIVGVLSSYEVVPDNAQE